MEKKKKKPTNFSIDTAAVLPSPSSSDSPLHMTPSNKYDMVRTKLEKSTNDISKFI
jgi:hypothetical protein